MSVPTVKSSNVVGSDCTHAPIITHLWHLPYIQIWNVLVSKQIGNPRWRWPPNQSLYFRTGIGKRHDDCPSSCTVDLSVPEHRPSTYSWSFRCHSLCKRRCTAMTAQNNFLSSRPLLLQVCLSLYKWPILSASTVIFGPSTDGLNCTLRWLIAWHLRRCDFVFFSPLESRRQSYVAGGKQHNQEAVGGAKAGF